VHAAVVAALYSPKVCFGVTPVGEKDADQLIVIYQFM